MSDKQAKLSRYAQAIYQTMVEKWQQELGQVESVLAANSALATQLADPSRDAAAKVAELDAALPPTLSPEARNLARVLVQEGDIALLPQIVPSLRQATSSHRGPTKAEVTSAVELTEQEQSEIRTKLAQEYGEGMTYAFSVDSSLLGGLRVRVGDRLTDTSVASRLALLRESLMSAVR